MADSKLDINYDTVKAAAETLTTANKHMDLVLEDAAGNSFSPLSAVNPDIGTHYMNMYRQSVEELLEFAKEKVLGALNSIKEPEDSSEDPGGSEGPPGGGNGPGESGDPGGDAPVVVPPVVSEVIDTSSLVDLDAKELDSIIDDLIKLAEKNNKGLDELLDDPTAADKVKEALLASPYIPDDLKKLLQEADSELVRQTIKALMKGQMPEVFGLNALNVGIVYSYLSKIASDNGITIEQLLNDPQYSELLKTHLAGFEDVVDLIASWKDLSPEEFQANLLKIYDGDGIGDMKDSTVNIMRSFVDYISDATGRAAEDLLLSKDAASLLKSAVESFAKTSVFMGAASHYSAGGMQGVINSLVDGTNAGALGMDEKEVTNFKSEIDALAKEKGVTSEKLLSDKQYAEDVKKALAESENAQDVGFIYAKSDASVSQNVAKNLYNTKFENVDTSNLTNTTGSVDVVNKGELTDGGKELNGS